MNTLYEQLVLAVMQRDGVELEEHHLRKLYAYALLVKKVGQACAKELPEAKALAVAKKLVKSP